MGRLTAGALACAALLFAGCGSHGRSTQLQIRVDRDPFRISIVRGGDTVVSQDEGARLRYQLAATGVQHQLTKVLSSKGNVYRVATNEPGRTATVTVAPTRSGFRVSMRLHPATNVEQVYDAFGAGAADHFLGGGEQGDAVDLKGRIVPLEVSYACAYVSVPYFAGSAGGGGCRFGSEQQCEFPPLGNRVEACVKGAALAEDLYVGGFARLLHAYQADAGEPRVPPPSELALVKWRDAIA